MARPGLGYAMALLAAACWGLNGSLGRSLMDGGMDALYLTQVRCASVVILVGVGLALFRRDLLRIPRRQAFTYARVGAAGLMLSQAACFYAIGRLQIGPALVIQFLYPLLIMLWLVARGRRLAWRQWVAAALALIGSALVVRAYDVGALDVLGVAAALGSAVATGYYIVGSERAGESRHPLTTLFWLFLFAAVALLVLAPPWSFPAVAVDAPGEIGLAVAIGGVGTLVPFACVMVAVRQISAAPLGIVLTLEAAFGALFALLLHGEALGVPQILGIALVLTSVATVQQQGPSARERLPVRTSRRCS